MYLFSSFSYHYDKICSLSTSFSVKVITTMSTYVWVCVFPCLFILYYLFSFLCLTYFLYLYVQLWEWSITSPCPLFYFLVFFFLFSLSAIFLIKRKRSKKYLNTNRDKTSSIYIIYFLLLWSSWRIKKPAILLLSVLYIYLPSLLILLPFS